MPSRPPPEVFGIGSRKEKPHTEDRSERIRKLQEEARRLEGEMLVELNATFAKLHKQLEDLRSIDSSRPGVESLIHEVTPQVDRLAGVVQGVINKQGGL